jgi:hypothetical protein
MIKWIKRKERGAVMRRLLYVHVKSPHCPGESSPDQGSTVNVNLGDPPTEMNPGYLGSQPAKLEDSHNLYQAGGRSRAPHGKYTTSLS